MAHYDLDEQEQLAALKDWWRHYHKLVITGLTLIVLGYLGWQGWHYYYQRQALQAMQLFSTLDSAQPQANSVQTLMRDYSKTPYAGRAAVLLANSYYNANNPLAARKTLTWASKNATEEAVRAVANLQLARLLIEDKQPAEALKILNTAHASGFDGLFWDAKGDAFAALRRLNEAKIAYQSALVHLGDALAYRAFTQQKLDALG